MFINYLFIPLNLYSFSPNPSKLLLPSPARVDKVYD